MKRSSDIAESAVEALDIELVFYRDGYTVKWSDDRAGEFLARIQLSCPLQGFAEYDLGQAVRL